MNHLVWRMGSGCDRTKRPTLEASSTEKKELAREARETALQPSLGGDPTDPSLGKTTSLIRENNNIRMSERDPVVQANLNPFMESGSYITDLETQDKFLRPRDSNYGQPA